LEWEEGFLKKIERLFLYDSVILGGDPGLKSGHAS